MLHRFFVYFQDVIELNNLQKKLRTIDVHVLFWEDVMDHVVLMKI